MVSREEKLLWAYADLKGEARADAINAMWRRLMEEYQRIPLWPEGEAPGYDPAIPHQLPPSLVLFPVESPKPRGTVLVAPGGGYAIKAPFEGFAVAQRFNELGLNAAVLDYRVAPYRRMDALADAQRALRLLRYRASDGDWMRTTSAWAGSLPGDISPAWRLPTLIWEILPAVTRWSG